MHEAEKLSLEQIEAFLNASQDIRFEGETQQQIYHWIEQVLSRQEYHQQSRQARGLLRSYLTKMTGLSRAQVTRLIARYRKSGSLQPAPYRRHRFPQRYTRADIELLATVDAAHENLSGPATRRILEREYRQYGKPEYERLSTLSVAHLYNLRQQSRYRERRLSYTRTRPAAVAIGERRCPDPQGQPGYLRVDTVHQGDAPAGKGVYHINAVDQVTQWEIVGATERISEAWLEPVLCALMRQFPFRILGFHSDNGSEFINRIVARLLNKLLIFDEKGRRRCLYRRYQTPLETLLALPNPAQYLPPRTHPRRLTTHRGNPQRHRSRRAHAAGETPALRAAAATHGRAVEMTEDKNPQPQERGFFSSLESAKKKTRFPHSHRPGYDC